MLAEHALNPTITPWFQLCLIFLATFVSEDLTCFGVGLLIRDGQVDLLIGISGCFLGILAGDLGLWVIGRLAGLGFVRQRWLLPDRLEALGRWLDRRGWLAILATRFLPGTRVPFYLAAGVLGRRVGRFVLWTTLACLIWTPGLILVTVVLGETLLQPINFLQGPGWLVYPSTVVTTLLCYHVAKRASTAHGRGWLLATLSRIWRWEFWPSWIFYVPLLPWLAYLSLRYRSALPWTAANPGIPQGGVIGESKFAILKRLPSNWVIPGMLVPPDEIDLRVRRVQATMQEKGWSFPLILKPDAGQRGAGVKLVRDLADLEHYLTTQPAEVIVQLYHPGPYEAGIFYYRLPDESDGQIFSITDKVFPRLRGDGVSTVEDLIWQHPRYRMQARIFLSRLASQRERVLAADEELPLAMAGNHCQGTMFRDGADLITPELERAVDAIAKQFDGFYIGRFDVRYTNPDAFRAGQDLAIVELNGATSESTNIYDPSWSLWRAYRELFRQWSLLYHIGQANRRRGHASTSLASLLRQVGSYYRSYRIDPLAD